MGGGEINNQLLNVNVVPSQDYVLNGVTNKINVLFQIVTGQKENTTTRTPCDLAMVLDRSGSMSGDKLENCKIAIKKVVDNLSSDDRFHLVIYDSKVDVIIENSAVQDRDQIFRMIDEVKARGSTDLQAGVQTGYELLIKHKKPGRIQRIFLFSDGQTNCGVQDQSQIFESIKQINAKGVSVTSFGIGSDFDEELMKGISEYGSGNYFFIESPEVIEQFVAKGLRGLLALMGTSVTLKIRGKSGAILTKVYSHPDLIKGADLGDLKQNNTRQIIAELDISPTSGEGAQILTWELSYIPDGQTEKISLNGDLSIKFTDDDKLLDKKNVAVEVALAIQTLGDTDLEVVKLIDKGSIDEAIAIKTKELERLTALEPVDTTGTITTLKQKTQKALDQLKNKEIDVRQVRKEIHYQGYAKRRNSIYAIND
eukprot:TRINITY_DN1592_c0_g1_i1.p1 TRINITY_DN1592_c0_g1~~TRINITY_DN1592_c0_g1_i1.p1  ORF type:complete len:425 (-),score=121.76 TRINITY_DN1592_c0_g1_i1:35-1309(-)